MTRPPLAGVGASRLARLRAREVLSVLEVAAVFGYLPPTPLQLVARFDVVIGTLVKLVR